MGTGGAAGRKCWYRVPKRGGGEAPRPSGSLRPEAGGVVSSERGKKEVLKCPRTPQSSCPATPDDPAGRQKQDPQLFPGAGFLSAREVSNVRSPPPCIPSGGQASHFPFRKGQSKRPGEAHQGEMEGMGPRLAPPAQPGPWPIRASDSRRPAGSPACVPVLIHFFIHSFTQETLLPPPRPRPPCRLLWARPCAGVLDLRVLMVSGEEMGIR